MTQAEKDLDLTTLQCEYAVKALELTNAVLIGSCKVKPLSTTLSIVKRYMEIFNKYTPFDSKVYLFYSFTFDDLEDAADTAEITIAHATSGATTTITYTGIITKEDLLTYFNTEFLADAVFDFKTETDGSTLYVYSYDSDLGTKPTVTVTSNISENNLISEKETLLNFWNFVTYDYLRQIVNHSFKLMDDKYIC